MFICLFFIVSILGTIPADTQVETSSKENVVWKLNLLPNRNYKTILENSTLVIECKLSNDQKTKMLLKDGRLFRLLDGYYVDEDENHVINATARRDSGHYECLHYEDGREKIYATGILVVIVPIKFVEFEIYSNSTEAWKDNYNNSIRSFDENDNITMCCCTNRDAYPQSDLKWTRVERKTQNQLELLNHAINQTIDNKLCSSIQIKASRKHNNEQFACIVNDDKSFRKTLSIFVQYKPEIKITLNGKSMKHATMAENSSFSLQCEGHAYPTQIKYEWFLDDQYLTDGETLNLFELKRQLAGNYSCRAFNMLGMSVTSIQIIIIYADIIPLNTSSNEAMGLSLRQPNAILINTLEGTSLPLQCKIHSNGQVGEIEWFFYQISANTNQSVNKRRVASISNTKHISTVYFDKVETAEAGYYSCSIAINVTDSLGNITALNKNFSYYLNVESPPLIMLQEIAYGSINDTYELHCDVNSNPKSNVSWFYDDELVGYATEFDSSPSLQNREFGHSVKSILPVPIRHKSQFGKYKCQAINGVAIRDKTILLKEKKSPGSPSNFHILEVTSNSVTFEWISPKYTGETPHYILNVNDNYNLTIFNEFNIPLKPMNVTVKLLVPNTSYEFKIKAYNSIGSSPFSQRLSIKTLPVYLKEENLPSVRVAAFDDIQEAICFAIQNIELNITSGIVALINIIPQSEYILFHGQFKKATSSPMLFKIEEKKRREKICISYEQIRNIQKEQFTSRKNHFNISIDHKIELPKMLANTSVIGGTYNEFKRLNKINISICFALINSICSKQITVSDNSSLLSYYISSAIVLAIFLLLVLIFILLKKCMSALKRLSKFRQVDSTMKRNPVYIA